MAKKQSKNCSTMNVAQAKKKNATVKQMGVQSKGPKFTGLKQSKKAK